MKNTTPLPPPIRGTRLPDSPARFFKPIAQTVIYLPALAWVLIDLVCGLSAFLFAQWATPYREAAAAAPYNPLLVGLSFGLVMSILRHTLEAHDFTHLNSLSRIIFTSILSAFGAIALVNLFLDWILYEKIGRYVIAYCFLAAGALTALTRVGTKGWVARARHRVLFIGSPSSFNKLRAELLGPFHWFFVPPAFLQAGASLTLPKFRETLLFILSKERPDEIVVEDHSRAEAWVMDYCLEISKAGCLIRPLSRFYSELKLEEDLDSVNPRQWLAAAGLSNGTFTGAPLKRVVDIFLSLLGMILGLIPGLLTVLLIKLTMPGPVFYRQRRVGQYGGPFEILKFRTMGMDAEKHGAVWAKEGDDRATPLGSLLRRTRLDELPQFWNIFRGDMSFVGPRPERPEFVEKLEKILPHYHLRHLVKPGLTGWAQIKFRYGGSTEDAKRKLAYDLYYVSHCSHLFDLSIVLKTIVAMARGAR